MNIPAFSKTYKDQMVLDFPGIEVKSGRIYGIIGSNGSGKSTFAKILADMFSADQNLRPLSRTVSVGYMPQKSYAFRMSVKANILLGNDNGDLANARMDALQIRHLENKSAHRLSGGETARMALARLMMKSYDLVILDEPTAAMDMESTILAEKLIMDYVKETGCALILVTHSLSQARRLADDILFFHKGKLLEQGSKDFLLNQPQTLEMKQFLDFYV